MEGSSSMILQGYHFGSTSWWLSSESFMTMKNQPIEGISPINNG